MQRLILSIAIALIFSGFSLAQGFQPYEGGLKVKLNDDGTKYFRLLTWHQVWVRHNQNNTGSLRLDQPEESTFDIGLRRSRFLMYAQLNKKFLIVTHFGMNNQNAISGGYLGTDGKKPQLYMHDAWVEYEVLGDYLHLGAGLHYWNGISRLTNASTLNLMTMDAPIFNWTTIEAIDQFARKIGVYAKGRAEGLVYQFALSDPFETNTSEALLTDVALYNPYNNSKVLEGYVHYEFHDKESNLLPYTVGSYLGTKKVFNIGAGFLSNPEGTWNATAGGDTVFNDIFLFSIDVFADIPLAGGANGALTAYAVAYFNDFGPNHVRNIGILNPADGGGSLRGNAYPTIGTGRTLYLQAGYLLPHKEGGGMFQPYLGFSNSDFEGVQDADGENVAVNVLDVGANYYLAGHHAKITLNYRNRPDFTTPSDLQYRPEITLQAMIYL